MMQDVKTAEQLSELVRSQPRLRVVAGRTKPATCAQANVSLAGLTGVLNYEPAEFTFTARAGTRLEEVRQMLTDKKQYLPFDPPLVQAGATLGGTVAAGLSGAGRFRYGGVRDFLLGAQIVIGTGEIVTTGSKVVKNAAGFDFPKLMVGSLGRFGVMTELTFKVFPAPHSTATIMFEMDDLPSALSIVNKLATSQLDLACLDLDSAHRVWARIAGLRDSIQQRAQRVLEFGRGCGQVLTDAQDLDTWRACCEFQWAPAGHDLVKVAVTPDHVGPLARALDQIPYRISAGGHLAWLAWPHSAPKQQLHDTISNLQCPALALTGEWPHPWLGKRQTSSFDRRLTQALDPGQKFCATEANCAQS